MYGQCRVRYIRGLDTENLIIVCTSIQPKEVSVPKWQSGMEINMYKNPF